MTVVPRRRYIAALAIAAAAILAAGVVLRPERAAAPPVTESERTQLQALAQRQSLQRRSRMMDAYARELSPMVARVRRSPGESSYRQARAGETLIVVAADDSSEPRWITTESGGAQRVQCGGREVTEVTAAAVIPATLENGVAFGLNENVVGVVVRCGSRLILTAPSDVVLMAEQERASELWACCGVRIEQEAGGLRVTAVRVDSPLAAAGLEPGDVVPGNVDLRSAGSVNVRRGDREVVLKIVRPEAGGELRLRRTAKGTVAVAVPAESAAYKLGLREGDIIVRANTTERPTPAAVSNAAGDPGGARLIVLRGDEKVLLENAR